MAWSEGFYALTDQQILFVKNLLANECKLQNKFPFFDQNSNCRLQRLYISKIFLLQLVYIEEGAMTEAM